MLFALSRKTPSSTFKHFSSSRSAITSTEHRPLRSRDSHLLLSTSPSISEQLLDLCSEVRYDCSLCSILIDPETRHWDSTIASRCDTATATVVKYCFAVTHFCHNTQHVCCGGK